MYDLIVLNSVFKLIIFSNLIIIRALGLSKALKNKKGKKGEKVK
jgi:hypothetical protein